MGGIYRRKGKTAKDKKFHRRLKTKAYIKDTDQVYDDMKPENFEKVKNQEIDETLPGLGQFYCVPCARYFTDIKSLEVHEKSKAHKQAMKRLKVKPYTHKEAEEAAKY